MRNIRRFEGHSGAIVTLRNDGENAFVRKQSPSPTRNDRLEAQARKQDALHRLGIPCPAVIGYGTDAGQFYFDMEYVAGVSVAHQCAAGAFVNQQSLTGFLFQWLGYFKSTATHNLEAELFHAKLEGIRKAVASNEATKPFAAETEYYVRRLAREDWSGIPTSACHGDLTLENIQIARSGYCLIDFDVPDLPSYFLDIAKLFQDASGHWCLRHSTNSTGQVNAIMALEHLRVLLITMVHELAPSIEPILNNLVILNLLRTLPYCRDPRIAAYVLSRIKLHLA